jgi:hypothetical protein
MPIVSGRHLCKVLKKIEYLKTIKQEAILFLERNKNFPYRRLTVPDIKK